MDRETGRIVEFPNMDELLAAGDLFVPIRRELTRREKDEKQIRMYSPCGCGSGKKFKFCCHRPATQATAVTARTDR